MKHLNAILLLLSVLPTYAATQGNDSLRREVTIVKDFTPIVREASKINTLPPVVTPSFDRRPVNYSYNANPAQTHTTASFVPMPSSEQDKTIRKHHRGYLDFGIGTYLAMTGNAGYHILHSGKDRLNIGLQYTSLNGNIPVNSSFPTESETKSKQTFYDSRIGLHYDHRFDSDVTFALNGAYRFVNFNYYGVAGNLPSNRDSHPFQWAHNFFVEFKADNRAAIAYDYRQWNVTAGYSLYSNRWGAYVPDASSEQHAYLYTSLYSEINSGWNAGADINIDFLQYKGIYPAGTRADDIIHNPNLSATQIQSVFMAEALPHIDWNGKKAHFRAGIRAFISVNDGTIFRFAPDIHFNWEFIDNYFLYFNIDGGKQLHTWNAISRHCIYFDPSQRVPSTYVPLDATGGFSFHFMPEISLSAYGGYEIASSALFQSVGQSSQAIAWQALNATCVKAGAKTDINISRFLTLSLEGIYRLWRHDKTYMSFDRPRWEASACMALHPHSKFDIQLGYNMQLGRDFGIILGKLADIHNLQASASYHPFDFLSIFIQGNNLLNRNHDYYYGLPAPKIQVMGGIELTF